MPAWKADAHPDAIEIDFLMLDQEAVPTFTTVEEDC
jgi:hypothetical protein